MDWSSYNNPTNLPNTTLDAGTNATIVNRRQTHARLLDLVDDDSDLSAGTRKRQLRTPPLQDTNAPDDLRVISQPPGIALADIASYAWQYEAMGFVRVYIVDTGADSTSPVRSC